MSALLADMELIRRLKRAMDSRGWTLSTAESCTGGLISAWIASEPGVSTFFLGGVVSYSGSVKENLLGVSRQTIEEHGEVSEPVARAMASGARTSLHSDWSLSVTGIAGPAGGSDRKPVGTVCFAFIGPDFEEHRTERIGGAVRQEIQANAAHFALKRLLDIVEHREASEPRGRAPGHTSHGTNQGTDQGTNQGTNQGTRRGQ